MNILIRYIEEGDIRAKEYAYCLINLYDYARLGVIDQSRTLSEDEKYNWNKKAKEYRDEIAKLIIKGERS